MVPQSLHIGNSILRLCESFVFTGNLPDMRVLGRVRLSRASEESTSVERQRELIESWSDQNDHTVVAFAEDLDISGSVDPFKTPALGPWLCQPKMSEWDVICAWKLDRLGRDSIRLNKLFGWCIDNDKTLVSTSEGIDLSTPVGRLIANVIAFLAEGEREAIVERTLASQKKLRELGRWGGGIVFYGFKPAEHDTAGWVWEHDPHSAGVLREIVERVLAGESTESVAGLLNQRGELAPSDYTRVRNGKPTQGKLWSNNGVRTLLRSQSLLGHVTHNRVTVRDEDGQPILKGPPLIERDVFDRLQAALESKAFTVTNRTANASPLLGIAVCGICDRLMHLRQHHSKARGKTYRYYQCLGGWSSGNGVREHEPNIMKADDLEELVEQTFLEEVRDDKARERVFIPAESHQLELDEAVRAVEEITPLLGTITSDTMRKRLTDQLRALDEVIQRLEHLPVRDSRFEYRESDKTYREAWNEADTEGRRQLLLKSGITAAVAVRGKTRQTPGALQFELRIPYDVKERLSK